MQQLVEIKFDSHSKYKYLLAKGFSEQQAEGIIEIFSEITFPNAATREDISEVKQSVNIAKAELKQEINSVRSELKQEVNSIRSEFKQELANLKTELTKLIYLNTFAIIGAVAAIVKLL